ncbi:MAG: sulfatase-like hydrolase/transferase [Anaerolineae bacterium]|jgi:arylsulfatase
MADQRPNILLITTDQQRFDASGSAGPSFLRTPHYDHLRREGIDFRAAYADCPICVPARVGIMTGRYVFGHQMPGNGATSGLPAMKRERTLPSLLRALGYQTAAIGKMHFTPQRARHGFDELIIPDDYYRHMQRLGYGQLQPMHHGLGQNELYPAMATVPEALTLTSWTAEQCVDYIRERRDPTAPFFLWCSFAKPHPPIDPPEPYYSMYRDCAIPEPVYGDWCEADACPPAFARHREKQSFDLVPPEVIREARAAYYGAITQIDYNMGRVFAALQDRGLFNDTLIVYTSDHGEFLGDHHAGAKSFFHEPSAHIPFVVRLPQCWQDRQHGTAVSTPVTHADILPTLVTAAGGTPPADVDGHDLVALARGQLAEPRRYLESMAGSMAEPSHLSMTDGRWKYMYYPEGAVEQLFDLQHDPHELRNLVGDPAYGDQWEELHRTMVQRHEARRSPLVAEGQLLRLPLKGDSTRDRRNTSWPGYHTELYDVDVRH